MRKKPWFPLSDETFKAFTLNWLAGQSVRRTWPSSFFFKVWRWIIRKWDLIDGKSIRGCIHHIGRKSSKEGDVDSVLNSVWVFFIFLPFYKRNNSDPMRNWKKKKALVMRIRTYCLMFPYLAYGSRGHCTWLVNLLTSLKSHSNLWSVVKKEY